ncbi:guanine nucleotide-binding protein G(o) subunit alpha [Polychytrium aggregatum]|uniref:guanine nucleotide-binding protein G(o) subunit alpha n=1 Tax=Polychytrium aggregatum TaxID=110093 RepID=UPI0022FE274F|nr:guanine nucleotide-binding protein G(o) subunit alpha [Polychytrium aggregatum]KAI9203300.1 guanine nucleotide-binding protein G(o) subunit alpha [Polychytrium aggregatum]
MCGTDEIAAEERKRSKLIDQKLKEDHRQEESLKTIKLLLLGSGESGKSTVLKQFKLLYGTGFTDTDLNVFRSAALGNLVGCMKVLITESQTRGFAFENPGAEDLCKMVLDLPYLFSTTAGQETMSKAVSDAIEALWKDSAIQSTFKLSHEFQLPDCCEYFMQNCSRICSPDFQPTHQDALFVRIMTSTISENRFTINGMQYRIYDVGGQRSERRKWMHYFDDVKAVLFVSAIGSYDQTISEDKATNRMVESINVFQNICNNPLMIKTPMLIFFNKIDLLAPKLKDPTKPLNKYFPEFTGRNEIEAVKTFFRAKFDAVNQTPERIIYYYYTHATDTNQIKSILKVVTLVIMQMNLATAGYM